MNKQKKPHLSFWQIWNLSFGFLGVQFGFALQNANVSRILSNLGADLSNLSLFWLAAPTMGLIIQPIVGWASDKTWNRLGRRSPFILGGALVSLFAMFIMPNAAFVTSWMMPVLFGAIMFALMDGSFNVTFQPFRSLVADMLPDEQRNLGYSVQSLLINTGAVIGSILPYFLTNVLGVRNEAPAGQVPPSVIWSFYIGGAVLILSVLVTILKTREYPPAEFSSFNHAGGSEKQQHTSFWATLRSMPKTMLQLAVVQLFAWFALYLMWVYTTPAVAQHYWHTAVGDAESAAYNEAGNWVGIIFGSYSLFAALFSIAMPWLAKKIGRKTVYSMALIVGAIGYISMYFFQNPHHLIISMVGVGIAWAAILSMPFAILSSALPPHKMGIYLGIFNFTIAGPQILSGLLGGSILKHFFHDQAIYILVLAGVSMLLAGISVIFVKDKPIESN
jgi:maltose/moltooligosaccharide transporter